MPLSSGLISISSSIPSCLPCFQFNNLIHFKSSVQCWQLRSLMKKNKYGMTQIYEIYCIENLFAKLTCYPLTGRTDDSSFPFHFQPCSCYIGEMRVNRRIFQFSGLFSTSKYGGGSRLAA